MLVAATGCFFGYVAGHEEGTKRVASVQHAAQDYVFDYQLYEISCKSPEPTTDDLYAACEETRLAAARNAAAAGITYPITVD